MRRCKECEELRKLLKRVRDQLAESDNALKAFTRDNMVVDTIRQRNAFALVTSRKATGPGKEGERA